MLVEGPLVDSLHILAIGDASLLRAVRTGIVLSKDSLDLVIEHHSTVTHIQNLEGLFDGDTALKSLVIHEELDEVEELSWLEVGMVRDATLIHGHELLLGHETIQVVINFPNDQLNLSLGWSAPKEEKSLGDVHGTDLVSVLSLVLVLLAEVIEHTVQLVLLNGLDWHLLEELGW